MLEPMASGGVPGPAAPPTHHAPPEDTPPDYTLPEDMPPNHAPPPPPQDMPLENGMAVERCMESHSQDGLQHESQVSSGGEMEGGSRSQQQTETKTGPGLGKTTEEIEFQIQCLPPVYSNMLVQSLGCVSTNGIYADLEIPPGP